MPMIPANIADALRDAVRARRAATAAWGRGVRGQAWLAAVQVERRALARLSDVALTWADSPAAEMAEREGRR